MKISSEFGATCAILGIGYAEVAVRCNVRPDTAKSWITGRRTPPHYAWPKLYDEYRRLRENGGEVPGELLLQRALTRLSLFRSIYAVGAAITAFRGLDPERA